MAAEMDADVIIIGSGAGGGTLRFGVDPQQSVFDPTCRSHEFDNLYVADASFMPSISAVNPSLTIMANALRVAEILRHRLGAA